MTVERKKLSSRSTSGAATALMSWSACAVGVLVFLIAGVAQAETLTQFSFGPPPPSHPTLGDSPTYSPDITASGLNVSDMTLTQDGVELMGVTSFFGTLATDGNPVPAAGKFGGWGASTRNNFFETVITAMAGSTFEVTAITYDILVLLSAGSSSGIDINPNNEGFFNPGAGSGGDIVNWTTRAGEINGGPSGLPIGGRTDLTRLEVRFFFSPQSADAGYAIDNVNIDGNVFGSAIPEPSTMLLLGSGLAGLGFFRRRR